MSDIKLYNIDCMIELKKIPNKFYDLAICDPPYGIGIATNGQIGGIRKGLNPKWKNESVRKFKKSEWDNSIPSIDYFNELFRVSKNQIIWGGNYFTEYLKPSKGWIFWDKVSNSENLTFSDGELAWTSFDKILKKVVVPWIGFGSINTGEIKSHPAQKPTKLYKWLLKNYGFNKDGTKRTILDTHFGSLSIGIACADMGFNLDAWEIDSDYFNAAVKRLHNHINQLDAFVKRPEVMVNGISIDQWIKELVNETIKA